MLKILTINPGSTSTKIAIYENKNCIENHSILHNQKVLDMPLFPDQLIYRQKEITEYLQKRSHAIETIDALAVRGGRLKPLSSGVYSVNEAMVKDAEAGLQGSHPANLAVVMAWDLFKKYKIPAYTVDPISVDELEDFVRITGIKGIQRNCLSHALNMKAVAKKAAYDIGKPYEESNFIIAHLGGGGSIGAHKKGRMVDVYNSDKEGPFSVERAGNLPSLDLISYLNEGKRSFAQSIDEITHKSGLYSYFESRDMAHIEVQSKNDKKLAIILQAYIYNISKYVCSLLPILNGDLDAVILTGGVCHSSFIQEMLNEKLSFLGKIMFYPGEFENESLAHNVFLAIKGDIIINEY
ncbi:MAG: butyrate kinase [Candidatus Atribacteria bacterium]|nr:butyrate kinase [Candidatus Atribacteria bacterium]